MINLNTSFDFTLFLNKCRFILFKQLTYLLFVIINFIDNYMKYYGKNIQNIKYSSIYIFSGGGNHHKKRSCFLIEIKLE